MGWHGGAEARFFLRFLLARSFSCPQNLGREPQVLLEWRSHTEHGSEHLICQTAENKTIYLDPHLRMMVVFSEALKEPRTPRPYLKKA